MALSSPLGIVLQDPGLNPNEKKKQDKLPLFFLYFFLKNLLKILQSAYF
jgi:hypothetical protein